MLFDKTSDPRIYFASMRTVLLFQSSFCQSNRDKFDGVYRYAKGQDWHVQAIQYGYAASTRRPNAHAKETIDIPALLDLWHPDGCIVEGGEEFMTPQPDDFGRIPVVFLDRRPDTLTGKTRCVYSDGVSIARAAAHELLSLGLENLAYVSWWEPRSWSTQRGNAFEKILSQHGKCCRQRRLPAQDNTERTAFSNWIADLPRPCGVFCVNDYAASIFISAALKLGYSVPDDYAVIGVDNDGELCENAPVSISSIPQDCIGAGFQAAKLLDRTMRHLPTKPLSVPLGTLPVIRRASTRLLPRKDARVTAAVEYIRCNACQVDIDAASVVRAAKCSRRQLDALFNGLLRHSILDEIHARRIEQAITLIREKKFNCSQIAERCGYRSASDFSRAFKRETGQTPSRYLTSSRPSSGARRAS